MEWILHPTHTAQWNSQINALPHDVLGFHASNWVSDFVETVPVVAHLKDAQTGKYILNNQHHIQSLGLSSKDSLIGLTAHDLFEKSEIYSQLGPAVLSWKDEQLKKTEEWDDQVRTTQRPLSFQNVYCLVSGFIEMEFSIKLPISSHKDKKTAAILTYNQDITDSHYNLSSLFKLYRGYYFDKQAITLLLQYLKIDDYFIHLPTVREMQMLFALHEQTNRKKAARLLNISCHTLASHFQHLKEKLIIPDLNEVLRQLRIPRDERGKRK